ncbi:hypothetical protein VVT58_23605 (plasmid) [Sphingobium sp. SJ10-10]|nr:hypothetical protein [Sphingobium sp. SJ10-10]
MADVSHRGFVVRMKAARARRTVVLCEQCHRDTHAGRLPDQREGMVGHSGEPHAVKAARAVRRGDQG